MYETTPTPILEASENAISSVQKTPNRVSLETIKAKISKAEYIHPTAVPHMTVCVLLLKNGFSVVGSYVPADANDFEDALGKQFSFEDALRQVWSLEDYILREYLADETASRRT